jgi:hypothetical protein
MKKLFFFIIISSISMHAHAATFDVASSFAQDATLVVEVYADPEADSINAVIGTLSYPAEYFMLDSVSTVNSVISMWLESPKETSQFDISGLKHIHFEGAIPGGFQGIRSASYEGPKQGLVMTVKLKAKKPGVALVILEEAALLLHDGKATKVSTPVISKEIVISPGVVRTNTKKIESKYVQNTSLTIFRIRNELVANNSLTLVIVDDTTRRTIDHYEVAETTNYSPEDVSSYEWKVAASPYVLLDQKAKTFTHTKAVYADGTYTYATLPPVENVDQEYPLSRILIGIVSTLLILYALYVQRKKGIR